jgi:RNA polymerase sigma-70 factor (ECF subfamily)
LRDRRATRALPNGERSRITERIMTPALLQPSAAAHRAAGNGTGQRTAACHGLRWADLESFRSVLTKYARRCLRNGADVEDVVQDTLTAAMETDTFGGRSAAGTWLHGILKHKIVDVFRRQARMPLLEVMPDGDGPDVIDVLFKADGSWRAAPAPWPAPDAALESRQLRAVLDGCLNQLPKATARAFLMRELMGLEVREICEVLGVSANHCYVMLFRARMRLRVLLERHGLGGAAAR